VAVPSTLLQYFQQVRPLAKCDAGDGRVVGQLLVDLVSSNPKDLPHAIREFAYRTAMLRNCGFAHIGDMLARLLSADVHGGPDDDATAIVSPTVATAAVVSILAPSTHGDLEHTPQQEAACDPASVTVEQAAAIGSMVARSLRSAHVPATALRTVVNKCAVLRTMTSSYVWFVPMLEVLTMHKATQARRSTLGKRLSSIVAAEAPSSNVEADEADEESSFSSVVCMAQCPYASRINCIVPPFSDCALNSVTLVTVGAAQVPVDARVTEVVDAPRNEFLGCNIYIKLILAKAGG
jgi:hypothetical protein